MNFRILFPEICWYLILFGLVLSVLEPELVFVISM